MRSSFPKLWSLDILGGSTATSRLSQSGDKSSHSKGSEVLLHRFAACRREKE